MAGVRTLCSRVVRTQKMGNVCSEEGIVQFHVFVHGSVVVSNLSKAIIGPTTGYLRELQGNAMARSQGAFTSEGVCVALWLNVMACDKGGGPGLIFFFAGWLRGTVREEAAVWCHSQAPIIAHKPVTHHRLQARQFLT